MRKLVSERLTHTFEMKVDVTCGFNHSAFPFDHQNCLFRYGTLDYSLKDINFTPPKITNWIQEARADYIAQSTSLDFDIDVTVLNSLTFVFDQNNVSYTGFKISLKRQWSKYVGNYFVPLFLFVVMSFLSFVIRIDQVSLP